jgi:hypothetical protein
MAYRSILGSFRTTTLESHEMALVLETLRSDETLDAGSLGVGFLAFGLGLDFATDDELADLRTHNYVSPKYPLTMITETG